MRGEEADHPDPAQVTCGVCKQAMVPRFVPDSVYPSLGYFACIYCGSMVMQKRRSQSASGPSNRGIRSVILIGVVATPVVVAVIAKSHCAIPAVRH